MTQSLIDISIPGKMARSLRTERINKHSTDRPSSHPCVIDEAFAGFERTDFPESAADTRDCRTMKHSLLADITAQLAAIDRQRERLAQLLQSIDAAPVRD
jgi:hypothetical protein